MKTQAKVVKAQYAGIETEREGAERRGEIYDALSRLLESGPSPRKLHDAVIDLMLKHGSEDVEAMLKVLHEDMAEAKIQALFDSRSRGEAAAS